MVTDPSKHVGWSSGWTPPLPGDGVKKIISSKDEKKIADTLGTDYKNHPAYPKICEEICKGLRTIPNILADYVDGPTKTAGW